MWIDGQLWKAHYSVGCLAVYFISLNLQYRGLSSEAGEINASILVFGAYQKLPVNRNRPASG